MEGYKMDFDRVVVQWLEFIPPEVLPRDTFVNLEIDFINTISGSRRAGKTFFCFQLMRDLLWGGVPKNNVFYVNFEDEKLLGMKVDDMDSLMESFYIHSKVDEKHSLYLFLDEIQNVPGWDAWVRRIYDTQKNVKLILTGSSSKLLSREISTKLRGRVINHEIYPLSFKECLSWRKIGYDLKTLSNSKDKVIVKKNFEEYIEKGGYPAVLLGGVPTESILQNYYNSMIFKDIVERHSVKEIKKLRYLANMLFESTSKEMSYNKLSNKLSSIGLSTSKNTIIEYISYFEDAYLFFQNIKYEYSITKQLGSIKKIYCIDTGLLNSVSFKFSKDEGKLLENLIYIELRRRGKKIYFHKNKGECDFILNEKNKVVAAIQVTHILTDENEQREINGLIEAMNKHNLNTGQIITKDQLEVRIINNKKIEIIPAWKWLLTP